MRWFWKRDAPKRSPDEELVEAKQQRLEAQRRLRESQIAARQVRMVSIKAMQIRADNQFSARLDQAFGSRPHNG